MHTYLVRIEDNGFVEFYVIPKSKSQTEAIRLLQDKYTSLKNVAINKYYVWEVNDSFFITSHRTEN